MKKTNDVADEMAQQERSNSNYYTSVFRYIYIYIYRLIKLELKYNNVFYLMVIVYKQFILNLSNSDQMLTQAKSLVAGYQLNQWVND